jgi:hypothetical protein
MNPARDTTDTPAALPTVTECLIADGGSFVSRPVPMLTLDFAGVVGDIHAGLTRRSGSREPWYRRGTEIRNDRQLTIVSGEEIAEVAAAMNLATLEPGWIGANLLVSGVDGFTALPPGTRLFFEGGVTLLLEGENKPCRIAGASIGAHVEDGSGFDLLFPKAGRGRRGQVASVEKPGVIGAGETFKVRRPKNG